MRFSLLSALFSPRAFLMAGWGALGGVLGFFLCEPLGFISGLDNEQARGAFAEIFVTSLWTALAGVGIGAVILAADNLLSMRGRWQRDLPLGVLLFGGLGLVSGGLAQAFYNPALRWVGANGQPNSLNPAEGLLVLLTASLVRGVAWAMLGAGLGIGLGILRRDWKAGLRGALGGIVGGYHGGVAFNFVALFVSAGGGSASRFLGLVLTGAAIAWCIRVAQEALQTAWLLGISTGPYEGKECPLNKEQVTVGRSESNDLALYRDETVPSHLGNIIYQNRAWWWEGAPVLVDGISQSKAPLRPGGIIQLGTYQFKFFDRARNSQTSPAPTPSPSPSPATPSVPAQATHDDTMTPSSTGGTAFHAGWPNTNSGNVSSDDGPQHPSTAPRVPPPRTTAPARPPVTPQSGAPPSVVPHVPPVQAPGTLGGIPGALLVLMPMDALHAPFSLSSATRATIGRAPANDWTLSDAAVSGQHALLTMEGDMLVVRDLDSTNGTFVNGQKLNPNAPHILKEGDRVRFGQVECFVKRK